MKTLLVSIVLLFLVSVHQAGAVELITYDPLSTVCSPESNYTANITYQHNLKSLLLSLSSNISGFATAAAGQGPDKVYGLALCRGDISTAECQNCTAGAAAMIQQGCPNSKSSTMWRVLCELRYSSSSNFMGTVDTKFFYLTNVNNATDPVLFNRQMRALVQNLSDAAAANSSSMFASGQIQYTDFQVIYGAVQCTRDLSSANCLNCLNEAAAFIPSCCAERQGAVVIGATCSIRYELYPFLRGSATGLQLPSPSVPPATSRSKNTGTAVIAVAVLIPLVLLCILIFGLVLWRRNSRKTSQTPVNRDKEVDGPELLAFSLPSIRAATNDFSESNMLGEGGYGPVYKGTIDGKEIAVKRLSDKSGQGSVEFKNEVRLIAKLQHRNLVRLLGYCMEDGEKILVYEFVPNNSVGSFLFDPIKRLQLDWATRLKIITGTARGLLYLHEDSRLKIIHRDLKPSNILLDNEMNPKISDFGMAKLCGVDETHGNTSRVAGTYGYMSPEYAINGSYSLKSDVFSFGVLLLELVSGRRNSSFNIDADGARDLLNYAWKLSEGNKPLEMVDRALGESYDRNEALRCIHIGLLCVQEDLMCRPTMSAVVLMLGTNSVTLPAPHPPGFYVGSRSRWDGTSLSDSREGAEYQALHPPQSTSTSSVTVTELEAR
ncbi:Cysteine-rich receptor-like protein kinase 25 [Nymphaea thermarum]|nr:Cysteine-rich receptor-like protein kinase 25 [Nymphaea thermarum]